MTHKYIDESKLLNIFLLVIICLNGTEKFKTIYANRVFIFKIRKTTKIGSQI